MKNKKYRIVQISKGLYKVQYKNWFWGWIDETEIDESYFDFVEEIILFTSIEEAKKHIENKDIKFKEKVILYL